MFYRDPEAFAVERIIVAIGVVIVCIVGVALPTAVALHG